MWVEKGERQFYNRISLADYSELRSSPIDWTGWRDLLLLFHPAVEEGFIIRLDLQNMERRRRRTTGKRKGRTICLGRDQLIGSATN